MNGIVLNYETTRKTYDCTLTVGSPFVEQDKRYAFKFEKDIIDGTISKSIDLFNDLSRKLIPFACLLRVVRQEQGESNSGTIVLTDGKAVSQYITSPYFSDLLDRFGMEEKDLFVLEELHPSIAVFFVGDSEKQIDGLKDFNEIVSVEDSYKRLVRFRLNVIYEYNIQEIAVLDPDYKRLHLFRSIIDNNSPSSFRCEFIIDVDQLFKGGLIDKCYLTYVSIGKMQSSFLAEMTLKVLRAGEIGRYYIEG